MSKPVRAHRDFWTDEMEQGRTLGVVYDNPRRPNEGTLQYAERVAILAGADAGIARGVRGELQAGPGRRLGGSAQ